MTWPNGRHPALQGLLHLLFRYFLILLVLVVVLRLSGSLLPVLVTPKWPGKVVQFDYLDRSVPTPSPLKLCAAGQSVPKLMQRVARRLRRDLRVDIHREGDPAMAEDRHRDAGVDLEGNDEARAEAARRMNRDDRHALPSPRGA